MIKKEGLWLVQKDPNGGACLVHGDAVAAATATFRGPRRHCS